LKFDSEKGCSRRVFFVFNFVVYKVLLFELNPVKLQFTVFIVRVELLVNFKRVFILNISYHTEFIFDHHILRYAENSLIIQFKRILVINLTLLNEIVDLDFSFLILIEQFEVAIVYNVIGLLRFENVFH